MKTKMTEEQFRDLNPCEDGFEFAKQCKFDLSEMWKTCERGDWMIWALLKFDKLNKPTSVKIAIACAEHVLPIFEKKYPSDDRPRKAIEAAKEFLKNPTEANRKAAAAAYAAARAAYAAAYAAAAYAAAAAAYADAAYAADAAARAGADAAYADARAAYAARKTERKWQADKIRELVKIF